MDERANALFERENERMRTRIWVAAAMLSVGLLACGSSDSDGAHDPGGSAGASGSSDVDASGAAGQGEQPDGGSGGAAGADGAVPSEAGSDADAGDVGPADCTAARKELLGSIDAVSTGDVTVLQTNGSSVTLYIDAAAGGPVEAPTKPFVYVSLADHARVELTDEAAIASTDWDLAFKRSTVLTNSGVGGPGDGGAAFLAGKSFDDVAAADAASATFAVEAFLDATCAPVIDDGGYPVTSLAGWYDYNSTTHQLTPKDGTFVVRGATGALYKVRIDGYYTNPDGSPGPSAGRFLVRVGAL